MLYCSAIQRSNSGITGGVGGVSFLVVCKFLLEVGERSVVGVCAKARVGTAAVAAGGKGAEEGCPRVRHHH